MTIKDEYEYLKTDLMIRLSEATSVGNIEPKFGVIIPKDEEDKYLPRGSRARLAVKRAFIILDNTYKKVRLYPTDEFIKVFEETENDVYKELKENMLSAGAEDRILLNRCTEEEFEKYTNELINRIKGALTPYFKELERLTPEDIEKELKIKENIKKADEERLIRFDENNPNGLFS